MADAGWKLRPVTYAGVSQGELDNAVITRVRKELNSHGSLSFSIPTTDPKSLLIAPLAEVQLWHNSDLVQWAIMARPQASKTMTDVECPGLSWYFERRYFGRADRHNYLTNPSFETGDFTGWTAVNTTNTIVSTPRADGSYAAQLVQATDGQDAYLLQTIDPAPTTGIGAVVTIVGHVQIDDTTWIGPALGARGLWVGRYDGVTTDFLGEGEDDTRIHYQTAHGTLIRFETIVRIPPDADEYMEIRLYSPGGTVFWDALSVTLMESLSSVEGPGDYFMEQATILENYVVHAQDSTYDKNDLLILRNCPATGVEREKHQQFAEHGNIWDGITEFTNLENGVDVWISWNATGTTRTFNCATERGTLKSDYRIEWGRNITDFTYSFDGQNAASSVTILGDGDGPDREEGSAIDTGAFTGGLILETVASADAGANIDVLDGLATERLRMTKQPVHLSVEINENAVAWFIALDPGDRVPVLIKCGWVQLNLTMRIIALELDPQEGKLSVELNYE